MKTRKRYAIACAVVLSAAGAILGQSTLTAASAASLDSCLPNGGTYCITAFGFYFNSICYDSPGPGECSTCWADPKALCPTIHFDVPGARDVE